MHKLTVSQERDNEIERQRYDLKAELQENRLKFQLGSQLISDGLAAPYLEYEKQISVRLSEGDNVLELGAGQGEHSVAALLKGAKLTAIDISENSLENFKASIPKKYKAQLEVVLGDMGQVEFGKNAYDFVLSAGALSYARREDLIPKLRLALKNGGCLIAVDSWNANPIYKINRLIHVMRGQRTLSTLNNMPNSRFIRLIEKDFEVSIKYFGALTFLLPLLDKFLSETAQAKFLNFTDQYLPLRFLAFKFVLVACKR